MYETTDELNDMLVEAVRTAAAEGKVQRIGIRDAEQAPIRGASGSDYAGIGGFDVKDATALTDLVLLTEDDLKSQGFPPSSVSALLAHRTRKLREAKRAGVFTEEQVEALVEAGYLAGSAE